MKRIIAVLLLAASIGTLDTAGEVGATGASPVASSTHTRTQTNVNQTLRALAKLRTYGYTWTTDAGALKAIKAWQRANGLVVDGIVGPQTNASLGLGKSVAASERQPVAGVVGSVGVVPSSPATPGAVEDIIRAAWPDPLEDQAVRIATRESRLQPGVRNACCIGLFQIHWGAHRSWLAALGITSASQLFDAGTNSRAAYALYQRADAANGERGDGWGPWHL